MATPSDVPKQASTTVGGVKFPIGKNEVLDFKEYDTRVVVVTTDGRKLEQSKDQPKEAAK